MELLSNAIRNHIKQLIHEQNLTVYELARRSNLTKSTVDSALNIRNKNPRISTIHQLIKRLNLSIPQFFNHDRFNHLK